MSPGKLCPRRLQLLAAWLLWLAAGALAEAPLVIGVPGDVLADYRQLVGEAPDFSRPLDYRRPGNRRDVAEVMLVQRALYLGGNRLATETLAVDDYLRRLQQMSGGRVALNGNSLWRAEADELASELWISQPLVRRGEFAVGLYVSEANSRALAMTSLDQIRTLRVVTHRNWKQDWALLEQLGFRQVQATSSWESMLRMVQAGRADLVLAPFSATQDLAIEVAGGRRLLPIPGLKLAFPGERILAVSKSDPRSAAIYQALERGLTQLRASGEIERAYREAGFFNVQTTDWRLINP